MAEKTAIVKKTGRQLAEIAKKELLLQSNNTHRHG